MKMLCFWAVTYLWSFWTFSASDGCVIAIKKYHDNSPMVATSQFENDKSEYWAYEFVLCDDGFQQSPVNINPSDCPAEQVKFEKELQIFGWHEIPISTTIENNGKTLEIRNDYADDRPKLMGGPLGDEIYIFYQVHFHWGRNNKEGSEHWLAAKQYPLEAHFLFVNSKYHSQVQEALLHQDGLAVISRLFEIDSNAQPKLWVQHLTNASQPNSVYSTTDSAISLSMLAQSTEWKYVSYFGSITFAPCNEVVTWIVAVDKVEKISEQDMDVLRNIELTSDHNFRALQHLNDRTIYCSSTNI